VVNSGSSTITVLTPTKIASWMCRSRWLWRRDSSLVIQRDSPVRVAILPSRLIANLALTNGLPDSRCLM
jgi:hypothetical protein